METKKRPNGCFFVLCEKQTGCIANRTKNQAGNLKKQRENRKKDIPLISAEKGGIIKIVPCKYAEYCNV
jgi:hypothetical protein